ncbi:hypothetical protein WICPIJ_000086 [Wickerhamomyces pijperi]|uniref:Uncharacterized protein n=1 Tax=Wickerhamomyces pijperi TaxID=599730 RepID=A0A9P8QDF5_WICPI|nr:hypothetical protein WICPIJ_000086 [Wickerhamomyces pijperi]
MFKSEITLLDLIGPNTLGDSDHPKELIQIITGETQQTAKDNQDVIDIMFFEDFIRNFFRRGHGLTNGGDMCVVPRVVVNERGSVSHTTDLVTVIPPSHDLGIFSSVHTQPVVSFSVIVNEVLRTVWVTGGKNHRWRGVGVGRDPDQELGVEEEGWPGGRLMFRDRGDDWDVNLGVTGVPQGVESTGPWSNQTGISQTEETQDTNSDDQEDSNDQHRLELLGWNLGPDVITESDNLNQTKHT